MPSSPPVQAWIRDAEAGLWLAFRDPLRCVEARRPEEVRRALREVERACLEGGLHAAGFVCYEAAPGLDPSLPARDAGTLPLVWFGLFDRFEAGPCPHGGPPAAADWKPDVDEEEYKANVERIRELIAAGHTYQANYTIRLRAKCEPKDLLPLLAERNGPYGAMIETGGWAVVSGSPELFFSRQGDRLTSKPMKGTRPRGPHRAADEAMREALARSTKDQAENLMIADMVRNDLGRLATPGSVRAERLFEIEKFFTVWQMTSTVACQTRASLQDAFGGLFPPASITGAPKRRTMEILRDLEASPRGVYTGAIGFLRPNGDAQFSVAIRTAVLDKASGEATYGVGGGIVWDSNPSREWAECWHKAEALRNPVPEFCLLETMRWEPGRGFWLLDRHLRRLAESAAYFDYPYEEEAARSALRSSVAQRAEPAKVRLLLDSAGRAEAYAEPLPEIGPEPIRLGLCPFPVSSDDRFLYHKTTHREVYSRALEACPGCDDAVLVNERDEVTESTISNIAVEVGGRLFTPPASCGLLPGTLRAEMLERGELEERKLTVGDLRRRPVYLINSVRGVLRGRLIGG